jgi:hypothetical protein
MVSSDCAARVVEQQNRSLSHLFHFSSHYKLVLTDFRFSTRLFHWFQFAKEASGAEFSGNCVRTVISLASTFSLVENVGAKKEVAYLGDKEWSRNVVTIM